jgi:hypothetical protein
MECVLCKKRAGMSIVTIFSAKSTSQLLGTKREGNQLVSTTQTNYYDIMPHGYPVCDTCIRRRGYGSGSPRFSRNGLIAFLAIAGLIAGGVWALVRALSTEKAVWLLLVPLAAIFVWTAAELYKDYRVVNELRKHAIHDRTRAGEKYPSLLRTLSEEEHKGLRRF